MSALVGERAVTAVARQEGPAVDLKVPGIILTVTGIVALIVSLTRGPNLAIPRRTGITIGVVLLLLGAALLVYTAVSR